MSACAGCAGPLQETYYSPNGDALCRRCYYAEQTRAQDQRAVESLAAEAPPGFKVAGTATQSSVSATRSGFLLLGVSIASVLLTVFALGRIYIFSPALALASMGAFARARTMAREQRRGTVVIVIGFVLSLLIMLATAAVTLLDI